MKMLHTVWYMCAKLARAMHRRAYFFCGVEGRPGSSSSDAVFLLTLGIAGLTRDGPLAKMFRPAATSPGLVDQLVGASKDLAGGCAGGVGCVLAGQPFDTVKVKIQTFPNLYKNVFSCLGIVMRREGVQGLYAGSVPALAVNVGENAVLFMCYGQCQKVVQNFYGVKETSQLTVLQNATAGSLAAVFSSLVVGPLELIKSRRQAQAEIVRSRGYGKSR